MAWSRFVRQEWFGCHKRCAINTFYIFNCSQVDVVYIRLIVFIDKDDSLFCSTDSQGRGEEECFTECQMATLFLTVVTLSWKSLRVPKTQYRDSRVYSPGLDIRCGSRRKYGWWIRDIYSKHFLCLLLYYFAADPGCAVIYGGWNINIDVVALDVAKASIHRLYSPTWPRNARWGDAPARVIVIINSAIIGKILARPKSRHRIIFYPGEKTLQYNILISPTIGALWRTFPVEAVPKAAHV